MPQIWVGDTQRHTHYWLICESCGKCSPAPARPDLELALSPPDPLRCGDCGDMLMLIQGWVEGEMWQAKRGAVWKHVATLASLPTRRAM